MGKTETIQVDIILPAYNEAKRIGKTIESIQSSTHKNWLLYIIDDCSKDNTVSVVQEYALRDKRIQLICNEKNSHIAISLNNGIKNSTNDFIFRIDAGDLFVSDRITKQLKRMSETDLDFCGGNIVTFNNDGKLVYQSQNIETYSKLKKAMGYINCFTHSTLCFKRTMIDALGGYRNMVPAEDYDLTARAFLAGFKGENLADILVKYHIYELGISNQNHCKQSKLSLNIASCYRHGKELSLDIFEKIIVNQQNCKLIKFKYKINRLIAIFINKMKLGRYL